CGQRRIQNGYSKQYWKAETQLKLARDRHGKKLDHAETGDPKEKIRMSQDPRIPDKGKGKSHDDAHCHAPKKDGASHRFVTAWGRLGHSLAPGSSQGSELPALFQNRRQLQLDGQSASKGIALRPTANA